VFYFVEDLNYFADRLQFVESLELALNRL
jgi:hypothetical protein